MKKFISLAVMAIVIAGVMPLLAQNADLSGKWELTVVVPQGSQTQEFSIEQTGNAIAVKWTSEGREYKGTGTVKGDFVEWAMIDSLNGQEVKIPFTGTIAKGEPLSMSGEFSMPGDSQKHTWKAVRKG